MTETTTDDRLDRSTILALVAMALAVLIVANDFTAFSVALPAMEKDLDSDLSTIQWVVNAYGLVFGVMIVTGGRLADMFGRRKIFFAGAGIFAGFSLLGGVGQSDIWVIVCRALMGIGGAMMWPAILGMTYDVLPESKAGLAGGLILGAAGFGNAIGPLIGGGLAQVSWRWIFFLNIPIAAIGVLATLRAIKPDAPGTDRTKIDYPGIATLSVGLVLIMIGLDQSSAWGIDDPRVLALMIVGALLVVSFVFVERRAGEAALVPGSVIGNPNFRAACLSGGIVYMFQVAGGVVGLAVNTAIVTSDSGGSIAEFVEGISNAFTIDAILALLGLFVAIVFVGGRMSAEQVRAHRPHLHRAHG